MIAFTWIYKSFLCVCTKQKSIIFCLAFPTNNNLLICFWLMTKISHNHYFFSFFSFLIINLEIRVCVCVKMSNPICSLVMWLHLGLLVCSSYEIIMFVFLCLFVRERERETMAIKFICPLNYHTLYNSLVKKVYPKAGSDFFNSSVSLFVLGHIYIYI